FWLALFCAAGLVALLTIGPKYARRQEIIEHKYRAGQEPGGRRASPTGDAPAHRRTSAEQPGSVRDERPADRAPAEQSDRELLIPLWPLVALLALLLAAALGALVWSRRKTMSGTSHRQAAL